MCCVFDSSLLDLIQYRSPSIKSRYTKLQEISKDEQEKLKSQGIDVSTTASASAGPLTFKPAEGSVSVSSEQKDKFEESIERTDIVTIGSKPPRDGSYLS